MLVYQVSVNENQELFLGIKYPKISLDFPRINSAVNCYLKSSIGS